MKTHIAHFKSFLTPDQIIEDPAECRHYAVDRTTKYEPSASLVVFPKTTAEVSQILKYCHAHDIKVVPSGGRTGLAGGAVAMHGEVILSLTRMNRILEIEPLTPYVHVEAGCVAEAAMDALKPHGLTLPVDFAAKGSASLGGNVSTNVGGVRVLTYGALRSHILGLKAVLADGTVLDSVRRLYKHNAGFDLKQLFIASEGTLGVVTEVLLKVVPIPGERVTFLLEVPDLSGLLHLLKDLRLERAHLAAVEFFNHACLEKVTAHLRIASPFTKESPFYALIEAESFSAERDAELAVRLLSASESGHIGEVLFAQSPEQKRQFWRYREEITESLSPFKPHKNDLSVPLVHLSAFADELVRELSARSPFTACLFGHLADGNIHVNLLKPVDMDNADFITKALTLDETIYDVVFKYDGSISAEHGIGLGKKNGIDRVFRSEELMLLKKIKRTLDPKNILNPGKIFDLE